MRYRLLKEMPCDAVNSILLCKRKSPIEWAMKLGDRDVMRPLYDFTPEKLARALRIPLLLIIMDAWNSWIGDVEYINKKINSLL